MYLDLAHHKIFRAKVGKGDINVVCKPLLIRREIEQIKKEELKIPISETSRVLSEGLQNDPQESSVPSRNCKGRTALLFGVGDGSCSLEESENDTKR